VCLILLPLQIYGDEVYPTLWVDLREIYQTANSLIHN
jgi:hypothetical protein